MPLAISMAGVPISESIQLRIVREISVRYLLRGTRPSGASHKRYRTLISRSLLRRVRASFTLHSHSYDYNFEARFKIGRPVQ